MSISQLVKDYTIANHSKLKKICEPLSIHLDIQCYTHFSIQENGEFSIISNFAEQVEYFFSENLHHNNPVLVSPSLLRTGCSMINSTESDIHLDLMDKKFKLRTLFLMLEKYPQCIKGYIFASSSLKNKHLENYVHDLELYRKFNSYFLNEVDPIIRKMGCEHCNLLYEKGNSFFHSAENTPLRCYQANALKFLKAIIPLTPREQQCLDLFKQGQSAQSTAAILGLSRRTVEHYFENIKSKLGCLSKWDLLSKG